MQLVNQVSEQCAQWGLLPPDLGNSPSRLLPEGRWAEPAQAAALRGLGLYDFGLDEAPAF